MINLRNIVFLLSILLSGADICAQVLRGKITDSSGQPLSYASVYIKEIRQGTATNGDGEYELKLPAGSYSVNYQYLGYMPILERITITDSDITKNVILTEQVFMIPEVRISASGKDPAFFIMRKAIGMAPFHLNQVKKYRAEVYIKGGGKIDKLPKMIQKQIKVEANETQIKEGQYYFTESLNVITFTAPDKYLHQVISSRTNIPIGESEASPLDYLEASFYQPVLVDIAISPLAPNAFSHYDFKFMGATFQGDYIIDKVKVTPKRKSQQLFEGYLLIVEDQWAIHSLDLTNENMAGTIRVKQLYTPVESGIWMPVSHEFTTDISIFGIKAQASYTSAVKYLEVEPDKSLSPPAGYLMAGAEPKVSENKSARQKEIEEIFAKSELTARDMSRLSRLNEKNTVKKEDKSSLEIVEKTTYIVEEDAAKKDSSYWEQVRPIPLTVEEAESIPVAEKQSADLAPRDTSTLSISVGGNNPEVIKSPVAKTVKTVLAGKRWQPSENTSIGFDGLLNLRSFSFNTVDGFVLGTGLNMSTKAGDKGRFSLHPSIRYAFSRKSIMWNLSANLLYNPMTSGSFFIRTGSGSREYSTLGVNPLINSVSSLFFRENWMKLYNSTFITIGHRGDLSNGLRMVVSGTWEKREILDNTTSFSLLKPENNFTENLPANPFINGDISDNTAIVPVNHRNATVSVELNYTPQNHYRISKGTKVNLGSKYPTFKLQWKHGYNYNDTLSGHFDMIKAEASENIRYGALSEFRWRLLGGGFINKTNLQMQDHYFFNTQKSPVLTDNFQDAFYLKQYYSISTPSCFAAAYVGYTTPYFLLKRIPGISRTLMRENLSLATLWTSEYESYTELGYSVSEIFLLAEIGVYTGFRNLSYDGIGFRLTLRLK